MIRYTYYLAANSSNGYVSFMDEYAKSFKKIIVLKNINSDERKKVFAYLRSVMNKNDISYDLVMRVAYIDSPDAVVIPEKSCVIADEGLFLEPLPLYSDTVNFYEDLNFDSHLRKELESINEQRYKLRVRMCEHMKEAKLIHDEWEKIYISNMDFKAFDDSAAALLDNIFKNAAVLNKAPVNINRFFGTLLPRDSVNYIDSLSSDLSRRIFIKGRPGTGKSTLLKRIVKEALNRGYDTESYWCSFDAGSLDMVVIRDIGTCIFDSTAPHEKFPEKEFDELYDIYDIAVNADTDDTYSDELMHISSRYSSEIKKAKECLYSINILNAGYDKLIDIPDEELEKNIVKITSMVGIA